MLTWQARTARVPLLVAAMAALAPPDGEPGSGDCAVCWSAKVTAVLTACGHSVLCADCLDRIMAGPLLAKCPLCSTPIPPRAWKAISDVAASSFHPESIEPIRAAEAAALREGRSAFPAGVQGFIDFVQQRSYAPGQETMLLRVAALSDGVIDATATLLDRGASINAVDARSGRTALHVAAEANAANTVYLLLQRGASAYAVDARGRTPMHCAAAACAYAAMHWLVTAGGPLESRDATGATPLLVAAAAAKDDPDCITALLRGGADIAARDRQGLSALHRAASANHVSCIETLVWHGANRNARARDGRFPRDCTRSLVTRVAMKHAQRGPPEALAYRPSRLGLRLVVAALLTLVGMFVKGLVEKREVVVVYDFRRMQMLQMAMLRDMHSKLCELQALMGFRMQPFSISMSVHDLERNRRENAGIRI